MNDLIIYTVGEAAQLLKTDPKTIETEIQSGQLESFTIGNEPRITEESILAFISRGGSKSISGHVNIRSEISVNHGIQKAIPFHFTWPNGFTEEYPEAYEGSVSDRDIIFEVKVGICNRNSAGQDRKRVTIFLNGRPTVEFIGTNDFSETGHVVSVVTLPNKKRLKPNQNVPVEYRSMNLVRFNSVVIGPRAATTMAVLAKIDDLDTMIAHAIIRADYRDRK